MLTLAFQSCSIIYCSVLGHNCQLSRLQFPFLYLKRAEEWPRIPQNDPDEMYSPLHPEPRADNGPEYHKQPSY